MVLRDGTGDIKNKQYRTKKKKESPENWEFGGDWGNVVCRLGTLSVLMK